MLGTLSNRHHLLPAILTIHPNYTYILSTQQLYKKSVAESAELRLFGVCEGPFIPKRSRGTHKLCAS
jgi:hypothetical protein